MNNRKRTAGRRIQTIVCAPTIKRRNAVGKLVDVPNAEAGKLKQIRHLPVNNPKQALPALQDLAAAMVNA